MEDAEMLKYLDVLLDVDPVDDREAIELFEDAEDLGLFEADADGALEGGGGK